jgi:hypothetical protein
VMVETLLASLWPRRSEIVPRSIHVGFVVDKVVLGELFFPFFRFSLVNIVPPELSADIWFRVQIIDPQVTAVERYILTASTYKPSNVMDTNLAFSENWLHNYALILCRPSMQRMHNTKWR